MTRVAWVFYHKSAASADKQFEMLVDENRENPAPDRVYLVRYDLADLISIGISEGFRVVIIHDEHQELALKRWYFSIPDVDISTKKWYGEPEYMLYKKYVAKKYARILRTAKLGVHCKRGGK